MIKNAINKIVNGEDLSESEAQQAMNSIMNGEMSEAQIAAFITALRLKGETVDEIAGFAQVMRDKATRVKTIHPLVIDTCGTGGDSSHSFNISTTAAFVIAGAGLPVAKHGNRSVSSKSGSADVLEALGVNLNLTAEEVGKCIDEVGIGFLFAPSLHGAMKYAIGPRREIGIRTVFNILGPLTNPAGAQVQILGVYDSGLTEVMAEVLARLGSKRAFVIHGHGGLDELSLEGPSKVSFVNDGNLETFYFDPKDYGFARVGMEALKGGDAKINAEITRKVLTGTKGPARDIVVINSALGLLAGQKAGDIQEGIALAEESIDSGMAAKKLTDLINLSSELGRRTIQ